MEDLVERNLAIDAADAAAAVILGLLINFLGNEAIIGEVERSWPGGWGRPSRRSLGWRAAGRGRVWRRWRGWLWRSGRTIHATKKLLDRVKQPVGEPVEEPSTALGNWYATALIWKSQAALFVNERTLLPVFVPLAPAAKIAGRLPCQLGRLLDAMEVPLEFILQETAAMESAKTHH